MKVKSKHNGITEYQLTRDEWLEMMNQLVGATIAQTMGPNWKDIYWSPVNRPYVKRS